MKAKKINFSEITIGQKASFDKIITASDVDMFAQISGDYNPLHVDPNYAQKTNFKKTVVHGMFLGALVSRLVGMELPGEKALLVKESLEFKKPAFVGDLLTVLGKVVHKSEALQLIELSVEIRNKKELLVSGNVHVKVFQ